MGTRGDEWWTETKVIIERMSTDERLRRRLETEAHQHVSSSEQIAEGVVQQVDEGGSIKVSVTHHLGGKQSLARSTAKQTSHHAIAHVHVMGDFLGGNRQ